MTPVPDEGQPGEPPPPLRRFLLPDLPSIARFAVVGTAVGIALWLAGHFILLVFAGVLVAVALRGAADFVSDRTGLPGGVSLALVILAILLFFGGGGVLMAPGIAEQFEELWKRAIEAAEDVARYLGSFPWGAAAMEKGADAGAIAATVGRTVASVFGVLTAFGAVLVVGAFVAATGQVYRDGFLRLFPVPRRARVAEILGATAHAMRWWFLGQLVSMISLGIMTGVGLWLLGIPLWPALALLTAVLTFIPYLGPILAAVPILLISFAKGTQEGLYVLALYLTVQILESNLITPLVQQRVVSLPPAVTLGSQFLFGLLFGMLGFILATPLVAGMLVVVRMAYVEDVLGDDPDQPALRPPPDGR